MVSPFNFYSAHYKEDLLPDFHRFVQVQRKCHSAAFKAVCRHMMTLQWKLAI